MHLTATLINYYLLCHRKLWLHAEGITMEHTSDLVAEGKWLGENTYEQRATKNQELELRVDYQLPDTSEQITLAAKIDFFDAKNGVVHEVKKSDAFEEAHRAQVLFYLFVLNLSGINATDAVIEYPKQRDTLKVVYDSIAEIQIVDLIAKATEILKSESCPSTIRKTKCRNCSYFDFCWSGEDN